MARKAPQDAPVADRPADIAFGQQLTAMQPRLRAFLKNLGQAPAGTEDLAQETLTRAWRSRATFDPARGAFDAWLLRIAFRAFLDERQRARRAPTSPAAAADEAVDGAPPPVAHAAARDDLRALLALLTPVERDVLLRFHREGQPIAAIAEALALPAGTVKSHLHRARARLWQAQQGGAS